MDDYARLRDEELVLLIRQNSEKARNTLSNRYYSCRSFHGRRACPTYHSSFDPAEFSGFYFKVFLDCESAYRFGSCSFQSFFETCLGHQMAKEFCRRYSSRSGTLEASVSLDDGRYGDDGEGSLHEVLHDSSDFNDPRLMIEYDELVKYLKKMPDDCSSKALMLVSLHKDGYSYTEAARKMKLTTSKTKTILTKLREYLERR